MDVLKTDNTPVVEPVTVSEAKAFLSIDEDTDVHDSLIGSLIITARQAVEDYAGVSLVDSTVIVQFDDIIDSRELPYGPVKSITGVTDVDGDAIEDYKTFGIVNSFQRLVYVSDTMVQATYQTGYTTVPESLKTAIKKKVADDFEQRTGFDVSGKITMQEYPNDWKSDAARYSRKTW